MEIKIGRSAHACKVCEKSFVHEELLLSLVRIVEGNMVREDFCPDCRKQADRSGAYSTWEVEYYDPKVAEQEPPEAYSPLRQLFYEAVASEDRTELAKAFLAGQLLRRQKVFRLVKESDEADGRAKTLLYADRIGNRLIEVIDPNFTYTELEEARCVLLERLRELEAPEEEPSDANPEEASAEAPEDNADEREPEQETAAESEHAVPEPDSGVADNVEDGDADSGEEVLVTEGSVDDNGSATEEDDK